MRIVKLVFAGLFAFTLFTVILKAIFFMTFALFLAAGGFIARKAYLRFNGYGNHDAHHTQNLQWQQHGKLNTSSFIEPIDGFAKESRGNYRTIEIL